MESGTLRKRILFLTGTRADFGKFKSLIAAVENEADYESYIFATGMHTLARYGATVDEIREYGFKNIYTYINQGSTAETHMDVVLASTIQGLGNYTREYNPDLIMVHGDRVEALAGAAVGSLNNVLVGHVEGGEVSGSIDELIRHAVTKLAHLHFVANEEARDRVIQIGENPGSIFVIGSPDIDIMLSDQLPSLDQVKKRYEIPFDRYGILIYHPVTTEPHLLPHRVDQVIAAVRDSNREFVVVYPNSDYGSRIVMEAVKSLVQDDRFRVLPSLRFEYFLTLLKNAEIIVGNSSAGVREAPVYGVPSVNVGSRQKNRFRYDSIIDVPEERGAILEALNRFVRLTPPSLHFGSGFSAQFFIEALQKKVLWDTPRQKQFQTLDLLPGGIAGGQVTS